MEGVVKGEFKYTGINTIDIDFVVGKWNHLWGVYQWNESYRLIKQLRKDSPITRLRLTISTEQAKELIVKLELEPMSGGFKSATTWKRVKDWNALLATN